MVPWLPLLAFGTVPQESRTGARFLRESNLGNVNSFLNGGPSSGFQNFGLNGLLASGLNPTAQFVGSYGWSMSLSGGNLNITLTNATTMYSAFYHGGNLGTGNLGTGELGDDGGTWGREAVKKLKGASGKGLLRM